MISHRNDRKLPAFDAALRGKPLVPAAGYDAIYGIARTAKDVCLLMALHASKGYKNVSVVFTESIADVGTWDTNGYVVFAERHNADFRQPRTKDEI